MWTRVLTMPFNITLSSNIKEITTPCGRCVCVCVCVCMGCVRTDVLCVGELLY